MFIIDRRLNPGSKSLENRQRFLRRAKSLVQGAVKKSSEERDIKDDIYPPRSIDRHSRPPDVSAFTLAKRIRRAVDRLDPQGVPRSYRGVRRTPSAPGA